MALETGIATIADLNPLNPSAFDPAMEGDDHIRLIKTALKNTFPNINSVVNATDEQLNFLVGVTSAIQAKLDDLQSQIDKEAYKITMWPGTAASIPSGYSLCDGGAVSRTANPKLFAAIGTTYGSGDGSTTFNKPDLRGVVPRGLDEGRGLDTGRTLGSYQADGVLSHTHTGSTGAMNSNASHTHSVWDSGHSHSMASSNNEAGSGQFTEGGPTVGARVTDVGYANINISSTNIDHTHNFTTGSTGIAENRVKNLAVNFMIKLG